MDTMETKKYQQGGEANMPSSTELQQEISKQLKEGVQPTEIVAALLQAQIPEQEIIIAFERLGVPENQIVNIIDEVSTQLESQPSPEEMAKAANIAGGQVCEKSGVVVVDIDTLASEF